MPAIKHGQTQVDLFALAHDMLDNSIHRPNILNYGEKDYPEQIRFHCSSARGRFISGGNRGGKTTAECVEAIWWATDTHPYLTRPEEWGTGPLQLRFIVVDIAKGVEQIILPELKRWIPASYLIDENWDKSWDSKNLILTFKNKSTIDFVTWGMEMQKLGGVARHIVFFDEEPPQNIFNESMMRLIDYAGMWVIAATPSRGMGWTFDLLWEPAQDPENPLSKQVDTFTLDAASNPYNLAESKDMDFYMMGMDKEEREVREHGAWVARAGLVFPLFAKQPTSFIVPNLIPPKRWDWYSSVDFGMNHPTAWLWHAVGPQGQIVTFAEHYRSGMTVPMHAEIVKDNERAWGRIPDVRVGDPHGNQKYGTTGTSYLMEYAVKGIYIHTDGIPLDVGIGVEKMNQYFELRDDSPWLTPEERAAGILRPMWVISENCPMFIQEMKKLKWATYESEKRAYDMAPRQEIHKKNDDAFDSARYFSTLMPDLTPVPIPELTGAAKIPTTLSYAEMMVKLREDDSVEFAEDRAGAEWAVEYEYQEDYIG